MRKTLVALTVVGLLSGPMSAIASAGPVPTSYCALLRFLGYENVRECEDPPQ